MLWWVGLVDEEGHEVCDYRWSRQVDLGSYTRFISNTRRRRKGRSFVGKI